MIAHRIEDDDDESPPAGKACERQTLMPGAHLRVYRRRADGFRRVEIQVFDVADITLYFTDEELANWHAAFAPELPEGVLPDWLQERRTERWITRWDAEHR